MIGFKYYTVHTGVPVLLKTALIDPWDVFRGEYVRLGYEISSIKAESVKDDLNLKGNQYDKKVYVALEKGDKYWNAVGIYEERPDAGPNQVVLKARLLYYDQHQKEYRLQYGIESYYVPEGEGKRLENLRDLDVVVKVDRFGNSVIETVVPVK